MGELCMHWLEKFQSPLILGHRGASKYAPENTMASFEMALNQGADGFELDTMLSADEIPVVIHDRTVDRTTDGSGKVDQLCTENLRILDAGTGFSANFTNEKIPLLEEVFIRFKNRALINVELKNYHNPFDNLSKVVIQIANKVGVLDQLVFSSFLPSNIIRIRQFIPSAKVALLCSTGIVGYVLRSKVFTSISPDFIHPQYQSIPKSYIRNQHKMHRKVNAWTVNQRLDMIELFNRGVDGIITDNPKLAYEIRSGMKK